MRKIRIQTAMLVMPIMLLILLSGCSQSDLDKNGYPKVFKIAISQPAQGEDIDQKFKNMEPLRLYLEKQLKIPVEFFPTTGYATITVAMQTKKIHLASMSPYPYLVARKKANVQALFAMGSENGEHVTYYSCILSKKSLAINTVEDLKAKASQLTIAFVDPNSTSGHIIPKRFLIDNGIDPDKDFKEHQFSTSHLNSILALNAGKVDVICVEVSIFNNKTVRKNNITIGNFNCINISQSIPRAPYCIRKDINPEFRQMVQDAYTSMKQNDTVAWKTVTKAYSSVSYIPIDSLKFLPAEEKWYDDFEVLVSGISGLELPK